MPIRYVRAAVALGSRQEWDVARILADAGVPPMLLADARSRVTLEQATRLAQAAWRHTDDELLGLAAGPVPRGTFRLLCYGLLGSRDAREVLQRLAMFASAVPGLPPLGVEFSAETTRITVDTSGLDDQDGLLVDALLSVMHRFLGWLLRSRLPLQAVEVPYAKPADLVTYADIFGMIPRFEAERAALVVDNAVLDAPVMREEPDLVAWLATAPEGLLARRDYGSTLVDQVRRLLEHDVTEDLSAEEVSSRLAMAGPTLRRKLREQGTSYRQIREDLLRDLAVEQLAHTDVTVAELSERLGFSETSAFVRAFRRWTGMAPGAYRTSVTEPPPPRR